MNLAAYLTFKHLPKWLTELVSPLAEGCRMELREQQVSFFESKKV